MGVSLQTNRAQVHNEHEDHFHMTLIKSSTCMPILILVCMHLCLTSGLLVWQAFVDKFRYNAKRASLVQSRIKAIERMADIQMVEDDPEYIFRCRHPGPTALAAHFDCS